MNYKKGIIYGCVFGLIAFGASYQKWYPSVQSYLMRHAETLIDEQLKKSFSAKTTRPIPADVNLSAYLVGMFAKEGGDFKEAATRYAQVIEKDPNNTELKNELLMLYALTGQIDKAVALAQDSDNYTQNTFFINQIKTAHWIKQGDYQNVIDFYNTASLSASDIILKPLLLTWSYAGLNNQAAAYKALNSIEDKRLEGVKLYHQALLASFFGQKTEARALYQSFRPQQLSSVNTLVSIADLFNGTPEWNAGNSLYDRYTLFLQQHPVLFDIITQVETTPIHTPQQAVADAFYTVALSFADLKLTERAVLLNNISLYLDDTSNFYKIGIAELYQTMEMYQAANEAYNSVAPESDIIRFKKSLNLLKAYQPEEALTLLKIIEPKNKTNPLIQHIIGNAYLDTGNYEKSIQHHTNALNLYKAEGLNKNAAAVQQVLAQTYYEQEKPDQMFEMLEEAILNNSQDAITLNFLGYELINRDINPARGLQLALRAMRLNPKDGHIIDTVAWGYYKQQNYQKALEYAKKAAKQEKGNAVILLHLGDIYQSLGQKLEAEAHYRKALASKKQMTPAITAELKEKLGESTSSQK